MAVTRLHSHPEHRTVLFLHTPPPTFITCRLFSDGRLDWCKVVPRSFDLHFSDNEQCWASFHGLFTLKKTKQNIFEKNWNGFSLEMGFLKVGCALKFLSITFLSTFLEGSFHQQPCECNSSKHWFYSCSYGEWQRGGGISSCSPLAALARGRTGGKSFCLLLGRGES